MSGSHATQGGEGFTFNHAAEITASFERVSGARAHGGADLSGRFAISRQSGGRNAGTPAPMQSGVNQVQQAAGVTAEEAKHVIEARNRNMRPEEVADHLKKLREQSRDTASSAAKAPPAASSSSGSGVNMNARAGLSLGAEKTLAAQTARAVRAADAYLRSEDGRRYSQAMTAFANERSYREGEQSRQEHRFDRTANYG